MPNAIIGLTRQVASPEIVSRARSLGQLNFTSGVQIFNIPEGLKPAPGAKPIGNSNDARGFVDTYVDPSGRIFKLEGGAPGSQGANFGMLSFLRQVSGADIPNANTQTPEEILQQRRDIKRADITGIPVGGSFINTALGTPLFDPTKPPQIDTGEAEAGTITPTPNFNRQLQFGMSGEDVKELQKFLNSVGFTLADEGEGSPGNETTFFGKLTQKAVQEFQKSQGIVSKGDPKSTGFGRFGQQTMKAVNDLATSISGGAPAAAPDITPTSAEQVPVATFSTDQQNQIVNTVGEEDTELFDSAEFLSLTEDQQEAIRSIFGAISSNDEERKTQLKAAFDAASKLSDPFFKQQIRLATDELERGFVSLDKDLEFREQKASDFLADLKQDIGSAREILSLDEQTELNQLERQFQSTLASTRQDLASRGLTQSSRRGKQEELLETTRGEIRESTTRKFGAKKTELSRTQERAQRDFQKEVERLSELSEEKKKELFRAAEAELGSAGLPSLSGAPASLGGIQGGIASRQLQDILKATSQFVF